MNTFHTPVMFDEVLEYLNVCDGCWYVDCTLGGGGHAEGILEKGGKVLGIDMDPESLEWVGEKDDLITTQDNFKNIKKIVKKFGLKNIKGIFFDLGASSYQLETDKRGFSFNLDAPLDMRMGPEMKVSAGELINGLHEKELAELFWKLGEERFAKKIARKIVEERAKKPIETTNQLVQIILNVRPRTFYDRTHPATKTFQALRIAVNDELNNLRQALPEALECLETGGRIVVISFHSLEDRIVKNCFKEWEEKGLVKILTKKPITPTKEEILKNPRARSGKLRVIENV